MEECLKREMVCIYDFLHIICSFLIIVEFVRITTSGSSK